MNKYKTEHYKNPVLNVEEFMSEHYDKNINNQIEGAVTECILCGKGIKAHSKHYDVVSGCGNYGQLIHKDDWKFADSKENKDGGFMGCWSIGSECIKKIKHIADGYYEKATPIKTEFQADNKIQVSARKSTNNNPESKTKGENDE